MSFHALIFDFVFIIAFSVSRLLTKLNFIPLLTPITTIRKSIKIEGTDSQCLKKTPLNKLLKSNFAI